MTIQLLKRLCTGLALALVAFLATTGLTYSAPEAWTPLPETCAAVPGN